jgi:hypothetical protein
MNEWLSGYRRNRGSYNGTFHSVFHIYQTHKKSPFHKLKPLSRVPYAHYLGRLDHAIGDQFIIGRTGLDIQDWYDGWADADEHGRPRKLAAGAMTFFVLKAAMRFGFICGISDCGPLLAIMDQMSVPSPKRRSQVATAAQVVKAREAAHAAGSPSRALAYAFQYETALRQMDVIGQWHPLSSPIMSSVADGSGKWIGLSWHHISDDMILTFTPSKTADTTEAKAVIDLRLCPMVLDELARIPQDKRTGPLIVDEATALPYHYEAFKKGWKADFKAAGIPKGLWGRDLRASAVTEARKGGASRDDASKVAAHANSKTTEIYDREQLEAHRRVARARLSVRGME